MVLKEQNLVPQLDEMLACSRPSPDRRPKSQPKQLMKCPRCDSLNTKFCYYNNYSLSQPRHFCKNCRRYWTKGGILRNVPVGGGCRKNKRSKVKNTEHRQRINTASDSTLSTTDPAAVRSEDSSVTNVSAFSSRDGSPSAPISQSVVGSCTSSGYFGLLLDEAGCVRSSYDGLAKHGLILGEQAGISNSHPIFSHVDTENSPSFLSGSSMAADFLTSSEADRMGFNFSSSPIFTNADMGLRLSGDMDQIYQSLPSHITGSNSTSDITSVGTLADRSSLSYYWAALHQLHKLGVQFEEGHTADGQSIREDPVANSWSHTKGEVNVAGHSCLEEINTEFPGSFDWQLLSEQQFETPGNLCCLPGGIWSDFSQLGPGCGPFT